MTGIEPWAISAVSGVAAMFATELYLEEFPLAETAPRRLLFVLSCLRMNAISNCVGVASRKHRRNHK
jgi:hypothetical protein